MTVTLPGPTEADQLEVSPNWTKASPVAPIPVVRCLYRWPEGHPRAGEQCRRWSLRGATKCVKHGGQLPNVREHAAALVESARLRLVQNSDAAVDWLLDLGQNATSEAVRLKAAAEVLDRVGVRGGADITVTLEGNTDPSAVLRERLATLQRRTVDVQPESSVTVPLPPGSDEVAEPDDTVANAAESTTGETHRE